MQSTLKFPIKLYLCRHGNTFDKGDKVVWVGKNEDMALTEKGQQQAKDMADQLTADGVTPVLYVAAHLKRTHKYTEIIRQTLDWDTPLYIDPRLAEVDYGQWGGKTTEEINEQFGEEALALWNSESKVPQNCGWGETETEIRARLDKAIEELQSQLETLAYSKLDLESMPLTERLSSSGKLPKSNATASTPAEWIPNQVRKNVDEMSSTKDQKPCVVITTSNGIIRLLLEKLDPQQYQQKKSAGTLKVPTGGWVVVD